MKKQIIIGALALVGALVSCQNKGTNYVIQGTFPSTDTTINGEYVYLYAGSTDTPLDSAKVEANAFTFASRVVVDSLEDGVLVVPRRYQTPVILEAGDITAKMEESHAGGTPLNDAMLELNTKLDNQMKGYEEKVATLQAKYATDSVKLDEETTALQESMRKEYFDILEATLKAHSNNIVGVNVLLQLLNSGEASADQIKSWMGIVGDKVKSDKRIKKALDIFESRQKTSAGQPFIDFEGVDDSGKSVKLSDYVGKGKYVLADFWASWCGPCRREIPNLIQVSKDFPEVQVLGIAVWDKMEDHLTAMKELGIGYPQIFNEREATTLYGIRGIPQIILFAPDGTIVERDLRGDAISALLKKSLGRK